MSRVGIAFGVTVGLFTAALIANAAFELFLADCFFEQGCGPSENLKIVGILLAACLPGVGAGWVASSLFKMFARPRQT